MLANGHPNTHFRVENGLHAINPPESPAAHGRLVSAPVYGFPVTISAPLHAVNRGAVAVGGALSGDMSSDGSCCRRFVLFRCIPRPFPPLFPFPFAGPL